MDTHKTKRLRHPFLYKKFYMNESTFTIDDKIVNVNLVDCSETGLPVTYLVFELKSNLLNYLSGITVCKQRRQI